MMYSFFQCVGIIYIGSLSLECNIWHKVRTKQAYIDYSNIVFITSSKSLQICYDVNAHVNY